MYVFLYVFLSGNEVIIVMNEICSDLSFEILSSICCNFLVPRSPHSQGCLPGGPLSSTSGLRRGLDGPVWVGRSWRVIRHQGVRPLVVHGVIRRVVVQSISV